jgi:hypothetical protein
VRTTRFLTNVIAAAGVAAALPSSFAAEPFNIKPGLWEVTNTMTMSGAPLYVVAMSATQRAEYAKSWAKTANQPTTDSDKQCITAKDLKEAHLFSFESNKGKQCKQTTPKQTATALSASSECKDEKTTTLTELNYSTPSPDRFTGIAKSTMTSPNGKTVIDIKTTGKWIAASCPDGDSEDSD